MNNPGAEETRSYRNIFKATTLFGGVQVYQILISIVKSKVVAVLLGASGLGIQGLYQSSIQFMQGLTSLGLSQSAVRDVSEANGSGDTERISKTVSTLRRLVWITGILGLVLFIALSPILSKIAFGNYDYTIPFIVLSCILLIDQLAAGQKVLLQGMRKLKELARASAIGSSIGLFVSIPLYYFIGIKGIVPTLILNSTASLVIFYFYARKIKLPSQDLSAKETFTRGKVMAKMGLAMSVSGIIAAAISYIIRSFIMKESGSEVVGFYQAGFVLIHTYVGMVFTAIGTDFYPRLAAINQDNEACRRVISQQGEIATQIMAPLLCSCILLVPVILRILYSDEFLEAGPFVLWCCPGMMFRLASWLIAYQFVAKAESRLYIITEIVGGIIYLSLSILGFYFGGLTGLGVAFTIDYIVYLVFVYIIASKRYGFSFPSHFTRPYFLQLGIVVSALGITILVPAPVKYWICLFLTVLSFLFAVLMLERKIGLISLIKDYIK